MNVKFLVFLYIWLSIGCSGLPTDPSPNAMASNDKTLIHGACSNAPNHGVDVCRVVEGSPIEAEWNIFLPWAPDAVSADIRVRFKDRVQTFSFADRFVTIPLKDVIGEETWKLSHDGPIQAVATIKFTDGPGDKFVQLLGYAYVIVLKKGYKPLGLQSEEGFGKLNCVMEFTESGRSLFKCSP